jgi:hypothetical protein
VVHVTRGSLCGAVGALATALECKRLGQCSPFVDDVMDPTVETAGTYGVEEKSAVIAAVEANSSPCRLRRAGHHNDLAPIMSVGQPGRGPGFSLRRVGMRCETDDPDATWWWRARRVIAAGDREVRGVAGAGECQTLLEPWSGSTKNDDGVRGPRCIGARPDKEDGREHQKDDEHQAERRQTGTQEPSALPVLH